MDQTLLALLNARRRERRAAVVVTNLGDGSSRLVGDGDRLGDDPLHVEIAAALRSGKSGVIEKDGGEIFLNVHVPPPRLVAIGAVHITQALIPVAATAGYDLIVVDPRTAFATPERFAGTTLLADWPETVLPGLGIDPYTAVAAVTHDPKIDDFAIVHALQRQAFYVGALGSRKTHARRRDRLLAAGVAEADIEAIRAPIGMDIGASSPGEIAVAIMAEVIEAFRRRVIDTGSAAP
ncbi:XdhC family protein [Chthonobacter rhizosphaerae]|uniref:XdhC family protein n=1 Tax=Chthonobacter rhizosphaerae TaxID=2735553 RepID=UPI0015EED802|nr:XdhC family protein [Chthonobacter rhizosphaerae]